MSEVMSDMPLQPTTNNVIEFGRIDASASRSKLLAALRALSIKRLGSLGDEMFAHVDDALFDLSERSGSSDIQARFFAGMREVRKKRQRGQSVWLDAVTRAFATLERGEAGVNQAQPAPIADLALIDESVLEEKLAVEAMVDKAAVRLNRPLYALEQRLAQLSGRKLEPADDPIGPRALTEGFADSLAEYELDVEVNLILLKLFERHVLTGLEGLYDEANAMLVQAGVMPDLRYQLPQGRGTPSAARGAGGIAPVAGEDHRGGGGDGGGDRAAGANDWGGDNDIRGLLGELTQLLAARRGGSAVGVGVASGVASGFAGGFAGGSPVSAPSSREMLNALSLLQADTLTNLSMAAEPPSAAWIKTALLNRIQSLNGDSRTTRLGPSEDVIDIVGLVFDYAVQDRNLPSKISALLGRLQIPYLKLALLDRSFIARHEHPARRLLDEMARSSIGWTEEGDRDGRLLDQIRSIVDRLNRDFDDDPSIFRRLLDEFSAFLESISKRAELSERRASETARGRERLEMAQRAAAQAIMARISGLSLPSRVREVLTRRWSNYLVLTHLRHGEDSSPWLQATQLVDDLAWSVAPKEDAAERRRLELIRPEIESVFRQGMQALGLHPRLADDAWSEIDRVQRLMLVATDDGAAPVALDRALVEPENLEIVFASTRPGEELIVRPDDLSSHDDKIGEEALGVWLDMARALKTGTWMEFIKDDGSRERAKLLWISTIRALYLFVNRNGVKIAEKTATEIAEELKQQRAIILEQVALVDRALDAIVRRLRENPQANPEEAPAATDLDPADPSAAPAAPPKS